MGLGDILTLGGATLAGGPMGLSGGLQYLGAKKQEEASQEALQQQIAFAREQMEAAQAAGQEAAGVIGAGQAGARGDITGQGALAEQSLRQGLRQGQFYGGEALGALGQGAQGALGALGASGALGRGALGQGLGGYEAALAQGLGQGMGALQQGQQGVSSLSNLLASQGAFGGFEQDPGYQFRLQQGEEAINRAASARGGRLGGRTLKELGSFGQGLASQEFGNFANRRMGELGLRTNLAGMQQAGGSALANLAFAGAQGLGGARLGTGQTLAGLETGLGQNIARVQQGLGAGQANIYGNLGAQAQAGYGNLANLQAGTGTQLANVGMQGAIAQGNALQGAASQSGQIAGTLLPQFQFPTQFAGQGMSVAGQAIGDMTKQGAMFAGGLPAGAPATVGQGAVGVGGGIAGGWVG